jgi:hypothetical protein
MIMNEQRVCATDTGMADSKTDNCRARLYEVAKWLNLEEPPISYDEEDGGILLDDALLAWCNAGAVSLDWVFCGDAKLMALAYKEKFERERRFYDIVRGFDMTEQRLLLEALESHRAGAVSLEDALAAFKEKVEAHQAKLSQ